MPFDMPYGQMAERFGFIPANHAAPQLFGAELRPVFDEGGQPIADYQRIVRQDTNATLEVIGKNYAFVDNRTLFAQFGDALEASGLETEGMAIATDYSHEGRRVFRQYLLPRHSFEVKPGVQIALRLIMQNSYDGSSKFQGRAGFYSFVCANGCIIGSDVEGFSLRHSGEIHARSAIAELVAAAGRHIAQERRLKEWPRIGVSDRKGLDLLNGAPGISKTQRDHLVHAYNWARLDEGPQGGANLWALFSTLSAWATHGEAAAGGMASDAANQSTVAPATRLQREQQVARIIECEAWQELETVG